MNWLRPWTNSSRSALRDLDRRQTLDDERPDHAVVRDGLVVDQLDVRPDAAGQEPLVLVDDVVVDVDLVEPACRELRPVLTALVLLVERHRDQVDQLQRTATLESRLDQLGLVALNDPLRDRLLDRSRP